MTEPLIFSFIFIVIRITSIFVILPITSYRGIPNLVKIFFSIVISYLLFVSLDLPLLSIETYTPLHIVIVLMSEVLLGLTIGFVVLMFFSAFRIAGQFIDVRIGLTMANMFDVQFGASSPLMSQLYYLAAIVVYFALDGHHYLVTALAHSLEMIPPGELFAVSAVSGILLQSFYYLWLVAFQIAAPVMVAVLITDISLGLISKTVPQLHVFLVGLPLKVLLGLLVIYLTLPYFPPLIATVFERLNTDLIRLLENIQ